jgi:predicted acyltransferase (DUF342 family)
MVEQKVPDMKPVLPVPDVPNFDPSSVVPQTASITALLAVLAGWLPMFIALIPAVYYLFLIYETKTVQGWLEKWRERRAQRRLAKAKAVALKAEAAVTAQVVKIDADATAKTVKLAAEVEAERVKAEALAKAVALKSTPPEV